jgi:DNA polymerase-3 subunit delta
MIFFFYGPNTYASRQEVRRLRDAYVKKAGSDFGLERIDGTTVDAKAVPAQLMAAPFLANSRLVIIENLGTNKPATEAILPVLESIPDSTVVIFYEVSVDKRTVYFKTLTEKAKTVVFEPKTTNELAAWVRRETHKYGGKIERPATNLLLELVGDDQWRLEQEVLKLVHYQPEITEETVRKLVQSSVQATIFDLVDSMTTGHFDDAIRMYRQLRDAQANEIYILTMMIWQLRNLILAKTAGSMPSAQLALKKAFLAAVDTDYQVKSGGGPPDVLLERLIYKVANVYHNS